MTNFVVDREEEYRRKMNRKRSILTSPKVGQSPETKRLEELKKEISRSIHKSKLVLGKDFE